jgi:hypothetical protein
MAWSLPPSRVSDKTRTASLPAPHTSLPQEKAPVPDRPVSPRPPPGQLAGRVLIFPPLDPDTEITRDPRLQSHERLNQSAVAEFAECMEAGDQFPPLLAARCAGAAFETRSWPRRASMQRTACAGPGATSDGSSRNCRRTQNGRSGPTVRSRDGAMSSVLILSAGYVGASPCHYWKR